MRQSVWKRAWKTYAVGAVAIGTLALVARAALQSHTSDELYQIPDADLSAVVAAADNGDVSAAARLQDHFLFWKEDHATGMVWMRRAADLGNVSSRDELIGELTRSNRPTDRDEAKVLAARWSRPFPH